MNNNLKDEQVNASNPICKGVLRTILIIHFIVALFFTVLIFMKPPMPSGFVLMTLAVYGGMGAWLLIINYLLVVNILIDSYVVRTKKLRVSIAF